MKSVRFAALLSGLICCLGAGTVYADAIDAALTSNARQLVNSLHEREYRNVAVLPFRVQKPGERPTFHAGLINHNLPERVGNAIILGMRPGEPLIGLCTDPVSVIESELGDSGYRTAEQRRSLFRPMYPVITGGRKRIDAFLTGKVILDPVNENVRVEIEVFDAIDPEVIQDICTFHCKLDDFILADASIGFTRQNGKRVLTRALSANDIVSGNSVGSAKSTSMSRRTVSSRPSASSSIDSPLSMIDFRIMYDNQPVTIRQSNGAFVADDPKAGQNVTFEVRNRLQEKLGVVVTVNGTSTLYTEKGQPSQMTRWVLEPGKLYRIKGFHKKDGQSYIPIIGMNEEDSRKRFSDFGGRNAGLVHVHIFRDARQSNLAQTAPPSERSLRDTKDIDRAKNGDKAHTLLEMHDVIHNASGKGVTRGLMSVDLSNTRNEQLSSLSLGDVALHSTMVIRYYAPPK